MAAAISRARLPIGWRSSLLAAALASLAVGSLAVAATAEAKRNLYAGGVFGPGIAALDIASSGELAPVSGSPFGGAISTLGVVLTPDGRFLYATSPGTQQILAFAVGTNGSLAPITGVTFAGLPDPDPNGIAITPDGRFAYVADGSAETVRALAIGTDGSLTPGAVTPLTGADFASGVAITPDGRRLYVTTANPPARVYGFSIGADGSLTPVLGSFVSSVAGSQSASVTPDGRFLYVAGSTGAGGIAAFSIGADGALGAVTGSPFALGIHDGVAVSPHGPYLYATNPGDPGAVSAFTIAADGSLAAIGPPVTAGEETAAVAVSPDATRVFAGGDDPTGNVSAFMAGAGGELTLTGGSPFASGVELMEFQDLVVSPDQGPVASVDLKPGGPARQVSFLGAGSTDPDGAVARYIWDFGDGQTEDSTNASPVHTYASNSVYTASLRVVDSELCSNSQIFTGQTMSCNGTAAARRQFEVDLEPPKLKLSGPRSQELAKVVKVKARCNEACRVVGRGRIVIRGVAQPSLAARALKVRRTVRNLPAKKKRVLKLRLPKKARKQAAEALLSGQRLKAKLKFTASQPLVTARPVRRNVKVTAPR